MSNADNVINYIQLSKLYMEENENMSGKEVEDSIKELEDLWFIMSDHEQFKAIEYIKTFSK